MVLETIVPTISHLTNVAYATDLSDIITTATSDLTDMFWTVLPPIFAIAVTVLSVFLAWKWLRRFVGGR